jgi:malate-CoA ligase subunit beta
VDIHEYQAKELLAGFGVAIPRGGVAYSPEQAVYRASEIGGSRWAVKAQIHSGARGKAGGIKLCSNEDEVRQAAKALLGKRLVTHQTGPEGRTVHRLYIEAAVPIEREIYLGFVLDRKSERVMIVASPQGGVEIEEISEKSPEAIIRSTVEPAVGLTAFQAREIAFALGFDAAQVTRAVTALLGCYRAFRDLDATMVEINPLVATSDGQLLALDCKMTFDDNALFRRPNVSELRDYAEEDPRESQAAEYGINYVALDGEIGCIVNGAGLAMGTMDLIKHAGSSPANFLDVGGGASPEKVCNAFRLVLADAKVKAILVNIFAGINRCDWVAQGVVNAVNELKPAVPLVVRLAGTNVEEGRKILKDSGLDLVTADTLTEAAEKVVAVLKSAGSSGGTRAPGTGNAGEQATGEIAGGNGKP